MYWQALFTLNTRTRSYVRTCGKDFYDADPVVLTQHVHHVPRTVGLLLRMLKPYPQRLDLLLLGEPH